MVQLTIFAASFTIVWFTLFGSRARQHKLFDNTDTALKTWAQCVFMSYDGVSQSSWIDACGAYYKYRFSLGELAWLVFCFGGQSIIVAGIFLPFVLHTHATDPASGSGAGAAGGLPAAGPTGEEADKAAAAAADGGSGAADGVELPSLYAGDEAAAAAGTQPTTAPASTSWFGCW